MAAKEDWEPSGSQDVNISRESTERILKEIKDLKKNPPCHMHVYFQEDDITKAHVLMVGELYTPYDGGFFYFVVQFPHNYPKEPPKVKLITTGGDRVRFGPNLYRNGMVCHSIIGTWGENSWQPTLKLTDVLREIQSMLQEDPYKKEPVPFLHALFPGVPFPDIPGNDMKKYDDVIRHETLRVAVCDMMEGQDSFPEKLREEMREEMKSRFRANFKHYMGMCKKYGDLNGTELNSHDPFAGIVFPDIGFGLSDEARTLNFNSFKREGKFDFSSIQQRLEKIKKMLDKEVDESWLPPQLQKQRPLPKRRSKVKGTSK